MSLHAAIRNDVINAFITREPRRDDVPPIDHPRRRAHAWKQAVSVELPTQTGPALPGGAFSSSQCLLSFNRSPELPPRLGLRRPHITQTCERMEARPLRLYL